MPGLAKELGKVNKPKTFSTYIYLSNTNKDDLGFSNCKYYLKNFQAKVKNPNKASLIIAVPKCSLKPLSKSITSAFKLIYNQVRFYNKIVISYLI